MDGRDAYVLGQEGSGRLWVATDGSGTVLRIVGPASAPDDLAFTDWGRARTFEQPPPAKIVEGSAGVRGRRCDVGGSDGRSRRRRRRPAATQ